jgi:hypothetical protein
MRRFRPSDPHRSFRRGPSGSGGAPSKAQFHFAQAGHHWKEKRQLGHPIEFAIGLPSIAEILPL